LLSPGDGARQQASINTPAFDPSGFSRHFRVEASMSRNWAPRRMVFRPGSIAQNPCVIYLTVAALKVPDIGYVEFGLRARGIKGEWIRALLDRCNVSRRTSRQL
jgi:hypothetical protein